MGAMASQITDVSYKRLAKRTKIYEFAQDRYNSSSVSSAISYFLSYSLCASYYDMLLRGGELPYTASD